MTPREICERFAIKHKVIFEDEGTCGFGRECVGFIGRNDSYIDHNPSHDETGNWKVREGFEDDRLYSPPGVNAYHKHDCLAVLGRGEEAIRQLAEWVTHLESLGEVEIVEYETGYKGVELLLKGPWAYAVRIKEDKS